MIPGAQINLFAVQMLRSTLILTHCRSTEPSRKKKQALRLSLGNSTVIVSLGMGGYLS